MPAVVPAKYRIRYRLLYRSLPQKRIKLTYLAKKPWITDGLKISITRKNALYKIFRQRDTAYNEMQYELYRDKVTKLTKLSEKKTPQYYDYLIAMNKNNLRNTWTIIKSVLNKTKNARHCQNKSVIFNERATTDKEQIVEKLIIILSIFIPH